MPEGTENAITDKALEMDMLFCNHAPSEKINQFFRKSGKSCGIFYSSTVFFACIESNIGLYLDYSQKQGKVLVNQRYLRCLFEASKEILKK